MHRRQFLTTASACFAPALLRAKSAQHVIVIGAGSAGMTAAYHLLKAGAKVSLLEASSRWGGRMKRLTKFADFPIDQGAEWIHGAPELLGQILGRDSDMGVETITYQPQTYDQYHNGQIRPQNRIRHIYAEVKFKKTTWYGFFEKFLLPTVKPALSLNAPVARVTQTAAGVTVTLESGRQIAGDHVIVTTPLSTLQDITFEPGLPTRITDAIDDTDFGQGYKVFFKFKERFYPDMTILGPLSQFVSDSWDSTLYYDAAFGKDTGDNILGLFSVAAENLRWANASDAQIAKAALAELDDIYDGAASRGLIGTKVQNWTRVPYIEGSYSMDSYADLPEAFAPLDERVYFAGEAMGGDNQSTVHGAAFSAIRAVQNILA